MVERMNKKLIYGVFLVALAIVVISSGVLYAWFSSSQSANANSFATGSLHISVNSGTTTPITKSNMKPGDYGAATNWLVQNTGNIDGNLAVTFSTMTSDALNSNLKMAFWLAPASDSSHTWAANDYYLDPATNTFVQSTSATLPAAALNTLFSYSGKTITYPTAVTGGSSAGYFVAYYNLDGATTGNAVQSQSTTFDLTFTLNQQQTTQNTGL